MSIDRAKILGGIVAVLCAVLVWNWIANWGLVTIDVSDAPLGKVIRSIERQAGVRIITNFDSEQQISMHVVKVPVTEALETLAVRLDGSWSLGYAVGASRAERQAAFDAILAGRRDSTHRRFSYPAGFMGPVSDLVPDPRKISWTVSPMESRDLHGYLDQFAQKTGATVVVAEGWNPDLRRTPKSGPVRKAIREAAKAVGGDADEVFLVTGSTWRGRGGPSTADAGSPPSDRGSSSAPSPGTAGGGPPNAGGGGPPASMRGERPEPNPEWIAERVQQEISQLPEDEQARAQEEFTMMRGFFEEMRNLPEDQRRAAAEEFFNNPAVQERMDEREVRRDRRRSPEQRIDRARRYVERKESRRSL